jgi:2-oxoisovalerate dehydrogenase E1 component
MSGSTGREGAEADALRDPISKMQMWLLREGILDAEGINRWSGRWMRRCSGRRTGRCRRRCRRCRIRSCGMYSEDLKPTDARFDDARGDGGR